MPPLTHITHTTPPAPSLRAQTNSGLAAAKQAKATSLYKKFTRDVEGLDFVMQQKDVDASLAACAAAAKSLAAWKAYVA